MTNFEIIKVISPKEMTITFRNKKLLSSSKDRYRSAVNDYFKYLVNYNLPNGIESVRKWLTTKKNPSTFNLSLQAIKEYLLKHFENESPERRLELREAFDSLHRKKSKESKTNLDYLRKEQVDHLCEIATPTISLLIEAMFWSGCRVSELLNIQLTDCKQGKVITIRVVGKGNKEREVYLPPKLYSSIRSIFKGSVYLFETKEKRPYRREYITHEISRQAKQKMGIEISAHTLRHSKAMFLKEIQGLSPDRIAKALGHSSVVTTLKYYFHGTPTAEEQGIE